MITSKSEIKKHRISGVEIKKLITEFLSTHDIQLKPQDTIWILNINIEAYLDMEDFIRVEQTTSVEERTVLEVDKQ